MGTATLELVRICESLPEAKQAEVTDFARFLLEDGHSDQGAFAAAKLRLRLAQRGQHR